MSIFPSCPDSGQLEQFAIGNLDATAYRLVQQHLNECPRCRRFMQDQEAATDDSVDLNANTFTMSPSSPFVSPAVASQAVHRHHETDLRTAKQTGKAATSATDMLRSGEHLGQYLILDILGRGGMGVVFLAKDTILKREVAIKVPGSFLVENQEALKRFIREGQAAAAVTSEHVVTIYSVEGLEACPYLVMEYVDGVSLDDLLTKSGPLPAEDVIKLGIQIAEGLAAAHAKGLVHRDIKPANILLERETRRVKITDFGLARAVDDSSLSRSGEVRGTPYYMAPEQALGWEIDHRADLFSLGSVLYSMCTGNVPFSASFSMAVLRKVCEEEPPPIEQYNPSIPRWLTVLIGQLHAKDPAHRVQTAAEVADILRSGQTPGEATVVVRAPNNNRVPLPAKAPLRRSMVFAAVAGLFFLSALPAFFFFMPRGQGGDGTFAESDKSGQAANSAMISHTSEKEKKAAFQIERRKNKIKTELRGKTIVSGQGFISVTANSPKSAGYLFAIGLQLRHRKSAKLSRLQEGLHQMPAGDYELANSSLPPGLNIAPQNFSVYPNKTITIHVTHEEAERKAGSPLPQQRGFQPPRYPPLGGRGQGGFPPFPPPRRKGR